MSKSSLTRGTTVILPHALDDLLPAMHTALSGLVDADATYEPLENVFVVLDAEQFTYAYAFLCVGLLQYTHRLHLCAEEGEEQIVFRLQGRLRRAVRPPTTHDLLPEREDCRDALSYALHRCGMAYALNTDGERVTLSIAAPRFRVQKYAASVYGKREMLSHFLAAMHMLAGIPAPTAEQPSVQPRANEVYAEKMASLIKA